MWPCVFCTNNKHCYGERKQCACPCFLVIIMLLIARNNADPIHLRLLMATATMWARGSR